MSKNDKNVFTQTSMEEKTHKELEKLRDENKLLQGKIKGYHTLSDMLKEKKEECKQLKELNIKLTEQLKADKDSSYSDDSKSTSQASYQTGSDQNKAAHQEISNPVNKLLIGANKSTMHTSTVRTADLFPSTPRESVSGLPVVKNGVTYPPQLSYPHDVKTDKYPMQESLPSESNVVDMKSVDAKLTEDKLNTKVSPSSAHNLFEDNLECDSLRIEDDGYVKVSKTPEFTQQGSTNATYGSSDSSNGSVNLINTNGSINLMQFPSGANIQDVTPKSKSSDVCNPPSNFEASEALQSLSAELVKSLQGKGNGNGNLDTDGPTSPIEYLTNVVIPEIRKLEEEILKRKRQNSILEQEVNRYRETNKRQMEKIQRLEHQINNLSEPNSFSSETKVVGWEYVNKNDSKPEHFSVEVSEAQKQTSGTSGSKLSELEEQNKKLMDANQKWTTYIQQVTENHRKEVEELKQVLRNLKEQENKRQSDFDKILLTAKRRQNDEEMAKEEAFGKLAEMTGQFEDLQRCFSEMQQMLNDTTRQKQDLASELTAFKMRNTESMVYKPTSRTEDHSTEVTVLKEQLKIFQEDFDRERHDRARAQSAKDDLNKQLDAIKKDNNRLRQQLKGAESSMKTALTNNAALQNEVIGLKNQLRQEREANARPIPNSQQPMPYPGYQMGGGYNNPQTRRLAQPETDPFAQPVAPYLFQNRPQQGNQQGGVRMFYTANHPQNAPELLPGAWNCSDCTYKNHPTRTFCEICGKRKEEDPVVSGQYVSGQSTPLMPRGENNQPGVKDQTDLSTDCGGTLQCCCKYLPGVIDDSGDSDVSVVGVP